jgi:hypothetical protein
VPRECTVCAHPDREAIDRALVGDSSNLSVSSLFGVSESAVRRHKAKHLPAKLVMAQAAEEVAQADDLLAQVRDLQARTLAILQAAESTRQHRTALSAIREARSNLELLAKLLGELDEQPTVNIALVEHPDYRRLEDNLTRALEPYPAARYAVADALKEIER